MVTEPRTAKSSRFVHISPGVERLLREVRTAQSEDRLRAGSIWTQTGYVFTTETGQPCDPRNALRALKSAAAAAGLAGVGLQPSVTRRRASCS